MKRFYLSDAVDTPPSPPENPSEGYPQDGSLSESRLPTAVGAYWFHMITEEFMAVLEDAGVEPSATNLRQLAEVMQQFRAKVTAAQESAASSAAGVQSAVTAAQTAQKTAETAVASAFAMRVTTKTIGSATTVNVSDLTPNINVKKNDLVIDAAAQIYCITAVSDDVATVANAGIDLNQEVAYSRAQSLTASQKTQALSNIAAVSYESQSLTAAQQKQALSNIGAVSESEAASTSEAVFFKQISSRDDFYRRPSLFTSDKRSVTLPAAMDVKINGTVYTTTTATTVSISSFGDVAGGDFYIYACVPSSGTEPTFVVSQNSTVPTGYTADTSRKIGGFHTLCADAGTLTYTHSVTGATVAHPLSGYVKGDILPCSRWDLWHRPQTDPEGMVYLGDNGHDVWLSIYLLSWNGTKLVSTFGGVTADGGSSKVWHGELFSEALALQGGRLPHRDEFVWGARGANEQTNIKGSADATTTGGHVDTAGRRMISCIGCEDTCGFLWQWLTELGFAGGSGWTNSLYSSSVDPRSYGQGYGTVYRLRAGGRWTDGSSCGSRSAAANYASADVDAYSGGRGASEPLHENALVLTGYPI